MLFVDTFNRYFERENIDAALAVLRAAGYQVEIARPNGEGRPLWCGRTFLAVGKVEEARREAERVVDALAPFVERGVPVIGLEPSCMFGFRDEIPVLLKGLHGTSLYPIAIVALGTGMRRGELCALRWRDVDFFERTITIRQSKTDAGRRLIPLNVDAWSAIMELYQRAKRGGQVEPEHFLFAACENGDVDPLKPRASIDVCTASIASE